MHDTRQDHFRQVREKEKEKEEEKEAAKYMKKREGSNQRRR